MKSSAQLMAVMLLLAAGTVHAQRRPTPVKPPVKAEKATWIGVTAREVPPVLTAQLDLPENTGLFVEMVMPDSPAAQAGVQANDVLAKLDDQILINPPQFATLVRNKKPGDKVQLTVLRKGKSQKIEVTLAEHEMPALPAVGGWRHDPQSLFEFVPMQPDIHNFNLERLRKLGLLPERFPMQPDIHGMPVGSSVVIQSGTGDEGHSLSTSQFGDGEHTITVEVRDGKKQVKATDRDGKVLFSGPYNTDEEKAKVPAELAGKIQRMEENQKRIPPEMFPPAVPGQF